MKRRIFSLGLMLAATFTLTNCIKEVNQPVDVPSAGIPFEIVASASEDTKTENDGMKTKWTADDAINLFIQACFNNIGLIQLLLKCIIYHKTSDNGNQ